MDPSQIAVPASAAVSVLGLIGGWCEFSALTSGSRRHAFCPWPALFPHKRTTAQQVDGASSAAGIADQIGPFAPEPFPLPLRNSETRAAARDIGPSRGGSRSNCVDCLAMVNANSRHDP